MEERESELGVSVNLCARMRERLLKGIEMVRSNLLISQARMKAQYDHKAHCRTFKEVDEVLVLIPVQGKHLSAKVSGLHRIKRRISDLLYLPRKGKFSPTGKILHEQ